MGQEKYFDDHNDLQNLLMEDHMLPSIAIDYANMALMIGNGNPHIDIYALSTDIVSRLYDEGWVTARREFKEEYPNILSEFDLIEDQCKNKRARFIIPFLHGSKQWLNIVRVLIADCIVFLLSDSSDDTMDDYEVGDEEEEIPLNVMWAFMNTPLWPLKVKAYWIRVPNIQEVEEESGARCFLHGYIIANFPGHAAIHLSLLKLHELGDDSDNLNLLCRHWVHDIMLRKKFFVPLEVQNIMGKKEPAFPYNAEWFEENCISRTVNSLTEYQELGDLVRDEDAAEKERQERYLTKEQRMMKSRMANERRHAGGKSLFMTDADENDSSDDMETSPSEITIPTSVARGRTSADVSTELVDTDDEAATSVGRGRISTDVSKQLVVTDDEADNILLMGSTDVEPIPPLPRRVTKYYNVCLPKTSEGYMILVGDILNPNLNSNDFEEYHATGYSTIFTGYRRHENGDVSYAEQHRLIRNYGDIITGLNDNDVVGLSFADVKSLLSELLPDSNNEVKFTLLDKTLIIPKKPTAVRHAGGKSLFMTDSDENNSGDDKETSPSETTIPTSVARGRTSADVSTELVDTDDEADKRHFLGIKHHRLRLLELDPEKAIRCNGCQTTMTDVPIFVALDENDKLVKYCQKCCKDKRPFAKEMLDSKLVKTFGKIPAATYRISNDVRFTPMEQIWENRIKEYNIRLAEIGQIKFTSGRNALYIGRPSEGGVGGDVSMNEDLVKDILFEYFPNELGRIKLERNVFHELSLCVMQYFRLHGICHSNDELYYRLYEAESEEWQYVKYNTWNQSDVMPGITYKIIDTEEEQYQENTAWLSFTNNKSRAEIQIVPCYYLKRWQLSCEKDRLPGTQNEYINVLLEAKDNANRWVEIPQGSSKRDFFAFQSGMLHHLPKSFRIQPSGENSCVFNSLVNALHYINDYRGRDEVVDKLRQSLDYSEYRSVAKTRRSFAAYVMNFCVKGYNATLLTNLDVLKDRSMWPTLCILKGNDGSTNHAVTIVENYIFDSNNTYALPLNESTLNWCCCGDEGLEVKFVSVPFAYRFLRHKPPPQLVLRQGMKNVLGVQAVIRSLLEIDDKDAAIALEVCKNKVTPDENVISTVREKLKSKSHQYVPLIVKDVNELLLQSCVKYPTMFLLHLKGSFHYAIFSSVGDQYFDGTRGESNLLTPENLCASLDQNNEFVGNVRTSAMSSLQIMKAYVFTKKPKTSVKYKKRKL